MTYTAAPTVLRTVPAHDVRIGTAITVDGHAGTVTARVDYLPTAEVVLTLDNTDPVRLADADPVGITRPAGDVALGTLTSEPGGFGAALARLGFGEGNRREDRYGGYCWTFDAGSVLRVISYTDDGDRAVVIGWDQTRPVAQLEAWRMEFSGSTPQSVVLAAIANALGQLPVTV